jgi:hypothetical protein
LHMPKITGVTPNTGVAGTPIKIQGEGFGAARGATLLEIGGKNVNHVSWGDKEITTAIPDGVTETPQIRVYNLTTGASELWQFNPPAKAVAPKPVIPAGSTKSIVGGAQVATSPANPVVAGVNAPNLPLNQPTHDAAGNPIVTQVGQPVADPYKPA